MALAIQLDSSNGTVLTQNSAVTLTAASCSVTSVTMPPSYSSADFKFSKGSADVSLALPTVTTTPAGCGCIDSVINFDEFNEILSFDSATHAIAITDSHTYTETERQRTVTALVTMTDDDAF